MDDAKGAISSSSTSVAESRKRKANARLQQRDFEMFIALAMARYLSTDQLRALFFNNCVEKVALRRLRILSDPSGVPTFLRKLTAYDESGTPFAVWALTDRGYWAASQRLGAHLTPPAKDIGTPYLPHTLGLNELFVRLVENARQKGSKSLMPLPFAWHSADKLRLVYRHVVNGPGARPSESFIQPDAMIELPSRRRRVFVEYETGTHTLIPRSPTKTGATVRKIGRYARYLDKPPIGGPSRYEEQFRDGWTPELLFVTPKEARATAIREAATYCIKRALLKAPTFAWGAADTVSAQARITGEIGTGSETTALLAPLNEDARALLQRFYVDALNSLKAARERLRIAPPTEGGQKLPEYPKNSALVRDLLFGAARS